jgi:hypothetical protein
MSFPYWHSFGSRVTGSEFLQILLDYLEFNEDKSQTEELYLSLNPQCMQFVATKLTAISNSPRHFTTKKCLTRAELLDLKFLLECVNILKVTLFILPPFYLFVSLFCR